MGELEDTQLGSYHLLKRIGNGGMGEVYLAEQAKLARQVAIKVIHGASGSFTIQQAAEAQVQFTREAHAIAALDHPYILPLYDFGEQDSTAFLVMPYVSGGSLASIIQAGPEQQLPLPWPTVLVSALIRQIAEALQFAHDRGVMHRDVKPDNILIRQFPVRQQSQQERTSNHDADNDSLQVVLADFGIARFLTEPAGTTGATGTPQYSAPEQLTGHPMPASDQYALACLAHLLLTGRHVFTGTIDELHQHHLTSTPVPPSLINFALSHQIDQVILRALAKAPTERFARIADFSQALRQAIQSDQLKVVASHSQHLTEGNEPLAALLPVIAPEALSRPAPGQLLSGPRAPAPPPLLTPNQQGPATRFMPESGPEKPAQEHSATAPDGKPTALPSETTMHPTDDKPTPLSGHLHLAPSVFPAFLRRKSQPPTRSIASANLSPLSLFSPRSAAELAHRAVRSTVSFSEMVTMPDRWHHSVVARLPGLGGPGRNTSILFRATLMAVAVIVIVSAGLGIHTLVSGSNTNLLHQIGKATSATKGYATGTPLNAATATAVAQQSGTAGNTAGTSTSSPSTSPGTTPSTTSGPQTTPTSTAIPTATATPSGGHYEGNRNSSSWTGWETVNWYAYSFVRASWIVPSIPVRNSSNVDTWVGFNGDSNELGSNAGYFARAGINVSADTSGHVVYDAYWQVQNTSGTILAQNHKFYPIQPGQHVSFNVWYDGTNLHFDFYDATTGWGNGGTAHTFAAPGWREYTADWIVSKSGQYLANWTGSGLTLTDCTASLNNSTWYPINANAYYSDTLVTSGGTIMAYPGSLSNGATQFSPTFNFGG